MDLHDRYKNLATANLSVLEITDTSFIKNPLEVIHGLVQYYNGEVIKGILDGKVLETFRMVLCYEYQLLVNSNKTYIPSNLKDVCFIDVKSMVFSANKLNDNLELRILCDIIILELVLYCDISQIIYHLENFKKIGLNCISNHDTKLVCTTVSQCFLEATSLYSFLYKNIKETELNQLYMLYIKEIELWLHTSESIEWRSLALILPRLIDTFKAKNILCSIWDILFRELSNLKDILTAICLMVDNCFPLELENTSEIYLKLCIDDKFWTVIAKGLTSSTPQFRKQALFLMKRVVDFVGKTRICEKTTINSIAPFIHCQKRVSTSPIDSMKQHYFLILEALEEKQNHLVTSALSYLPNLIKGHEEHISCNNCFAIRWVRCVFERILHHENSVIVKRGLMYACKMNLDLYDDQFLSTFTKVLNNTYIYECQNDEPEPQIVNELAELFQRAAETQLLKRFVLQISKESWGPVALFNVLQALRISSDKTSQIAKWETDEINAMKVLISKNLNMHSRILRIASQTEILRIICNSVKEVRDLNLLASTLVQFPAEEALIRETYPWNLVTTWLNKIISHNTATDYVSLTCKAYLEENTANRVNPTTFAFMILLLHDAKLILQSKTCPAEKQLHSWLYALVDAHARPYASIISGLTMIEFISRIIKLCKSSNSESIHRLIAPYVHHALNFLMKNLRKAAQTLTYHDLITYLTVVEITLSGDNEFMSAKEKLYYIGKLRDESIEILQNVDTLSMHCLCELKILHLCTSLLPSLTTNPFFPKPFTIIASDFAANDNAIVKGKIMSDYCVTRGNLILQYITAVPAESWPADINWIEDTTKLFDIGGHEILPIAAAILKALVNKKQIKNINHMESLKGLFNACWNCTFLNKKNNIFWQAIQNLLGIIVNSNFFVLPESTDFAHKYLAELLQESDSMPNLKRVVLTELETLDINTLKIFQEILLESLVHGHASRRDKRIENKVRLSIINHFKEYFPQFMSMTDHNVDATIRAYSAILLHRTIIQDGDFASTFLTLVLSRLEKFTNKRYFNHSYLHKVKHRLMQVLLILEPVLNKPCLNLLRETICKLILLESNQHSVRIMQEWLLIRIFLNNEDLQDNLWSFFQESIAQRPGCTSSIASIIYHTAKLLPSKTRCNFIHRSLPYISQCCLGQQFNIRLYNQFVLVKLFELIPEPHLQADIAEYKGLYNAAIHSLKQGNLLKNSVKLQDDFYFSVFDPLMDYSLETIYFELPRLCNMDVDEFIDPELFKILTYTEATSIHPLKLFNSHSSLADSIIPSHFTKSNPGKELLQENEETCHGDLNDIQRKINPWKTIIPDYDEVLESYKEIRQISNVYQEDEGIIVVASLIDRPPNLGGLARTCEIFGVKKLVIGNLNYIKDLEFQRLSVSAEKWLTTIEVKPHQVKEFLLAKKDSGWSLVGIEQTANSTNLLKMKFEKKTILVLGNEKDGIPANLIPIFDACVEVPQVGLVRSLNVHVTGAICIWQYANQHIFF